MATDTKTNLSHETLRRLAQRVVEVIGRHGDSDPMLKALAVTLGPVATAYMDAYDAGHAIGAQRQLAATRETDAVAKLHDRCLGWAQVIARDLPRFNPTEYSVRVDVSHDVIANARKLMAFVTGFPAHESPLAYAQQIVTELSELIPLTQQDANATKAVLVTQQTLQTTTRETAAELYRQLLLFRRVLRRLLGPSHRDCQLLNFERVVRDEASKAKAAERRAQRAAEKAQAKLDRAAKRAAAKAEKAQAKQSGVVAVDDTNGVSQPVATTPTLPEQPSVLLNGAAPHPETAGHV